MKQGIHPDYKPATIVCSCGNRIETRSTQEEIHVEICAVCHPFYTGRQKLVDTAGRVERFKRKYGDVTPEDAGSEGEAASDEEAAPEEEAPADADASEEAAGEEEAEGEPVAEAEASEEEPTDSGAEAEEAEEKEPSGA